MFYQHPPPFNSLWKKKKVYVGIISLDDHSDLIDMGVKQIYNVVGPSPPTGSQSGGCGVVWYPKRELWFQA